MNVLFDVSATQGMRGGARFHGGGEYAKAVLTRLADMRRNETIAGVYDPTRWLDPAVRETVRSAEIKLVAAQSKKQLGELVSSGRYHLFYSALPYAYYDVNFGSTPLIFTIHGLRPLEMPTDRHEVKFARGVQQYVKFMGKQLFRSTYVKRKHQEFSRLLDPSREDLTIVVPSRHTKESVLTNFSWILPQQVRVAYSPRPGEPGRLSRAEQALALAELGVDTENYILLVSAGRWIKNAYRACRALDQIISENPSLEMTVLVLGIDRPKPLARNLINSRRFVFHGYVESPLLDAAYARARVFLFPTLNEGFGYPPLESMKHGTPVACSAITSVPEICGDAVVYFDPFQVSDIKENVLLLLNDSTAHARYSMAGRRRYSEIAELQNRMLDGLCEMILGRVSDDHSSTMPA